MERDSLLNWNVVVCMWVEWFKYGMIESLGWERGTNAETYVPLPRLTYRRVMVPEVGRGFSLYPGTKYLLI